MMTDRQFIDDCIKSINDYRRSHQVAPLTHNSVVSTIAQRWADHMSRTGSLGHNPNASYSGQPLGENCALKWFSDKRNITGDEVVSQWYAEVKNYNFRLHNGSSTGHFTQLVWKSSREVGIGRAQSRDGKWFVVANFFPAGNVVGRHSDNVLPPRDGKVILPPSLNGTSCPSSQGRLTTPERSRAAGRDEIIVPIPQSSARTNFQQRMLPGSEATVVQRRQHTQTVGGVTKSVVTEIRRDRDGNMTSTTTESTSHDDTLPSRLTRVGVSETRGFFTSSTSPTSQSRYHQSSLSSSSSPAPAAAATTTGITRSRFNQSPLMSSRSDQEFRQQVLRQHNVYRKQHGNVGDLKINEELCKIAEQWAQNLTQTKSLQHSTSKYKDQPLGENLAYKFASNKEGYKGEDVVKEWYSEISKVNFKNIETALQNNAGHFTQVVWKDSREIGIGRAFADNGQSVYVVCNYFPAGNFVRRIKENVLPAK